MYKKFKILVLFFAVIALAACQKDLVLDGTSDIVISDTETLTLRQEGETKTVSFPTLTGEWSIEPGSYEAWLTAEKVDGNLAVTAGTNAQADERVSQITINLGNGKKTITVTQFGSDPFISIEGSNGTEVYNHEQQTNQVFKVITNTNNWQVKQVDGAKNDWLTFTANPDNNTLTINLKSIERGSQWELTSRSEKLFLSNGNKHYQLNIIQNGFLQFQLPVWDLEKAMDLNTLTALETERGNSRDREFEIQKLLPYGDEMEKLYYVFRSAGEQAPHTLYYPDYTKDYMIGHAILKAPQGQAFNQEALTSFLEQNNFKPGNKQYLETESEYYKEDGDRTLLLHIDNDANSSALSGGIYKSAYMRYYNTSNALEKTPRNIVSSFPVGGSQHLNDKAFKLEQVIAFEKARGMKPDFNNEFNDENITQKISDPGCPYASLLFVQEQKNTDAGALVYVTYLFNWQGVTDEQKDQGLTADINLNGTVGACHVFYMDPNIFYRRIDKGYPPYYSYFVNTLRSETKTALSNKGYNLVRDDESGLATFYRGEEDLIDIRPQETRTVITYYKSKHYVDLIKKRFNP